MEDSTLLCDVTGDTHVPKLDDPITMDEMFTVTNKHLKDESPSNTTNCNVDHLQYDS